MKTQNVICALDKSKIYIRSQMSVPTFLSFQENMSWLKLKAIKASFDFNKYPTFEKQQGTYIQDHD